MRIYSDAATHRLEDFARTIGVECQIRKIEAHQDGRYFIVSVDDQPLKWPVALGFTDAQAQYALKRRAWERYAVRAESNKLDSAPSGSSSRRFSKRRRYPW
jgi:hypothetical protein